MEFIDDKPVVSRRARFKNQVEIDDAHAEDVKDGRIVFWLVRSRCQPPQYREVGRESEDRYRLNVQAVEAAVPLEGALRDEADAYLATGGDQGYLRFDVPTYPEDDRPGEQLDAIRRVVETLDAIGDGETVAAAVERILHSHRVAPPPAPAPEPPPPVDGDVERVASIYGPSHSGRTQAILEEAFRD